VLPDPERVRRGPVAVLECVQEIPCNPCEAACPFGAITVGEDITGLPVLDAEKCRGCGACISRCPGLAIFVVDGSGEGEEGLVMLPYEYLPLPAAGSVGQGLDREGVAVCDARVVKVNTSAGNDGTAVLTLAVPKDKIQEVRGFRAAAAPEEVLICRCCEVTEAEVRAAVREGATTLAAVKARTRAGMGLCQGRTCRRLVSRIIAEETGQPLAAILPPTSRPPVRTVNLGALAEGDDEA